MAKKRKRKPRKTVAKKLDTKRLLITQLKRFDYGKNQMNRVLAPIAFVMSFFTLLKVYEISFNLEIIGSLTAVSVVMLFFVGYIWDKSGLVEEEIEYHNERNRFVKAVLESKYHKAWLNYLKKSRIRK